MFNAGAPLIQPVPQPVLPTAESARHKGLKTGVKLMLASAVMFPLVLAFAIGVVDSPAPLLLPFTVFLAGLARMIYARFLEDAHPVYAPVLTPLPPVAPTLPTGSAAQQPAPPPRSLFAHGPNTNDLPQQPSVTDQTTGLLKR
jgi:hypothetical protein